MSESRVRRFKKGDRVQIPADGFLYPNGQTGTIAHVYKRSDLADYRVTVDDGWGDDLFWDGQLQPMADGGTK